MDRRHNLPGGPLVGASDARVLAECYRMEQPPYAMDATRRDVVLKAVRFRCDRQNWMLLAAHVRTNHVHLIAEAEAAPERIMNDLKSYASRCLNQSGLDSPNRKRWARHGSTRWLWNREQISAAIIYVIEGQGETMSLFER